MSKCVGYVDNETEFFNGTVWKPISEYQEGEKVLQYHDGGKANLVEPLEFIHEKNDEPFYECMGADYITTTRPGTGWDAYKATTIGGYSGCFTKGLKIPYYNRKHDLVSKAWGDMYNNSKQSAGGCEMILSCAVEEICSKCGSGDDDKNLTKILNDYVIGREIAEKLYNLNESGSFDKLKVATKVHLCERAIEDLTRSLAYDRMCEVPEYLKEYFIEADDYDIEGVFNGVMLKPEVVYHMSRKDWSILRHMLTWFYSGPYTRHAPRFGREKKNKSLKEDNIYTTYSLKEALTLVTRLNMCGLSGSIRYKSNGEEYIKAQHSIIERKELGHKKGIGVYAYAIVDGRYSKKSLGEPMIPYFKDWGIEEVHKEDKYNFTVPSHGVVYRRKGILFVAGDSSGKDIE